MFIFQVEMKFVKLALIDSQYVMASVIPQIQVN